MRIKSIRCALCNRLTSLQIWRYFVQILIVEILEYELLIMDKVVDAELKMLADFQISLPCMQLMLVSMAPETKTKNNSNK